MGIVQQKKGDCLASPIEKRDFQNILSAADS